MSRTPFHLALLAGLLSLAGLARADTLRLEVGESHTLSAAQAIRQTARGIIAMTPVALPMMAAEPAPGLNVIAPAEQPKPAGMSLPMA